MSAEVNKHVDLVRTDALRLLLNREIRECMVVHRAAQALGETIRSVTERIRIDIVLLHQPVQKPFIEERRGRAEEMLRDESDPKPLMAHICTQRQRLLMAVERRVHIELRLELLRREVRHGMA